jgi:FixJ family two-component response regulator
VPRRKPVLIVDDDISLSRSLERLLTAYGFEAEVFNSAETFCEYADLEDGLCLVLDINLRGRSGLDLRRQLTMSGAALPVIFITGNDSENIRKAAVEAGCVAYLPKPFAAKSLVDAIAKASTAADNQIAS